jgi:hypothetical protein
MTIKNTKQELLAEINRLKESLIERGYRNLWRAIMNSCPKCGHDTTEDGCANCLREALDKKDIRSKRMTELKSFQDSFSGVESPSIDDIKFYLHKY